ncbi:hypothetical protein DM01DRAFT_1329254 [Hesseltinella vesiculosa]|uniref:Alpha/beta hydrolase fold-3 domain-containing protein n=1 Tax=Hesseltinella vesiculosa TaxID=101127 RepID=A0A1X2G453_9FUNG|nr:hypothetical protein DM01DRAFT_1329254 [Hesseltinella vesiculosa]
MMRKNNITMSNLEPVALRQREAATPRPPGFSVPDTVVQERDIPVGDHTVKLISVRPPGAETDVLPGLIYLHGGGWVIGSFKTHEKLVKDVCALANVAVLFVDYSLSPEVKFPVAVEEVYEAALWIHGNAASLNVDSNKLVMAGDSAGGTMTAVTALLLNERGHPDILKGQVLLYPSASERPQDYASFEEFGKGDYVLSQKDVDFFTKKYLPDGADALSDFRFAPLLATDEQMKGLPRAMVITAECDVLRDNGEHYARRLTEAGVDTTCIRMIGAIHGYASYAIPTGVYKHTLHSINAFIHDCF